jgi:tripartite ATP-independent transporter DctM subunit
MLSILMTLTFVLLMLLRMPVSMAIGIATIPPLLILDRNLIVVPQFMLQGVHSTALLAVPFFVLAGNLFSVLGLSGRIWAFAQALVGHIRGGLGHVMVVANMIFSGISGSALADAAALGLIGIPAMERAGFRRAFAAALTLCSSVIGPMIPPSINMVIYGVIAQVSIGRLFLGGVVPGFIIGFAMMLTVYIIALRGREPCPVQPRAPARKVVTSFFSSVPALLVPVMVVVGMGFGVITPTEVGIFAAAYALALGFFYREASLKEIWEAVASSAKTTINIMFIIAVSTVAGWIYTYDGTSQHIAEWLFQLSSNKYVLLLLINIFLLVLGFFLEPIPMLILSAPIVLPVVQQLGVDLVHFGVLVSFNITLGMLHPPVGIGLYVMTDVAKVRYEDLVVACLPFFIPLLVCLLLFTYVPELSLWLPNLVMGK